MARHSIETLQEQGLALEVITKLVREGLLRYDEPEGDTYALPGTGLVWTTRAPSQWPTASRAIWDARTSVGAK